MSEKLEVSFNSPQCGWMSVGFSGGDSEFHTTTAHEPHEKALSELLEILSELIDPDQHEVEKTLKWNRNPEEFDFVFRKDAKHASLEIIEYPTEERNRRTSETVFQYTGNAKEICRAFYETFEQLYAERLADEFEQNWRQPFPIEEFNKFRTKLGEEDFN
jgi:hypothetical protein